MKIVRFATPDGGSSYGIREGDSIRGIDGLPYDDLKESGESYRLGEVKLLSPCLPSKVIGVQRNSHRVVRRLNIPLPPEPMVFLKPSTSVINPGDNIVYPESSHWLDYEGEVAVVMKSRAFRVSREEALDYVLGYSCINDVCAMDWLYDRNQITISKSFDTFAPIGPCIETEFDPLNFRVETYLNGELAKQGDADELVFSISEEISFISQAMTLLPGDVIATGTPGCNGSMKRGDKIEVKIEPIGTLVNYVV